MKYTHLKILQEICQRLGITVDSVFESRRQRNVCDARRLFMYWLRINTNMTLTEIGQQVRTIPLEYTSVIHAIKTAKNLIETDHEISNIWTSLQFIQFQSFTSLRYSPQHSRHSPQCQ